jgi:hypothetical protein
LNRSDKVADLCFDLQWPHSISLRDLDPDRLCHLVTDLRTNVQTSNVLLAKQVNQLRLRARENLAALDAVVGIASGRQELERAS